jgi:hypothetical protein
MFQDIDDCLSHDEIGGQRTRITDLRERVDVQIQGKGTGLPRGRQSRLQAIVELAGAHTVGDLSELMDRLTQLSQGHIQLRSLVNRQSLLEKPEAHRAGNDALLGAVVRC